MKQKNLLTTMLLLFALIVGSTSAWAETPVVTADFTVASATNNQYSNTWTYGNWSLTGCNNNNGDWAYIRCGGKGGTQATSTNTSTSIIKGTVAINKAIKEVKLLHNGTSNNNFTVNSIVLEVATDAAFSNITNTITDETAISKEVPGNISFTTGAPYAADSYYRITINWTVKGKNNYGLDVTKVEFYEAVSSGKADAALSFSPADVTVAIGGEETVTFSKSTDAAVNFVVDDETVATYNPTTGKIQGLKEGTTTITATSAETEAFDAGEATCTISVVDPSWIDLTAQGYTNAQDIETVNGLYGTLTFDVGTNSNSNGPKWYDSGSAVRLYTDNAITLTAKTGFVLTSVEFSVTSGSMSANNFDKEVTKDASSNIFTLTSPVNEITYTTTSNFRIDKVKLNIAAPVTVPATGFSTYVNATENLDFTDTGITPYVIKAKNANSVALEDKMIVAKNEPVLLYKNGGTSAAVAVPVIVSATAASDNLLVAGTGASVTYSDTNHFYVLATDGDVTGFYRANNNPVPVGKAYLNAGAAAGARFFALDLDGESTGIAEMEAVKNVENGKFYNLNGQQVSQPTKGLYIVNGRKVVVK